MAFRKDIFGLGRRNTAALVASLVVAFAIWLVSNLSKTYGGVVAVPVVATANVEGHADESANVAVVTARCRTSGFGLLRLRRARTRRPVQVTFRPGDLRLRGGDWYYLAGAAMQSYVEDIFGPGTELEGYISDSLVFRFPEVLHRKVPVELVHNFSYRSQYMAAGPVELEPDSVTVYAEESRLQNITRVRTLPVSRGDIHSTVRGERRISPMAGVRVSAQSVSYTQEVTRYVELRTVMGVAVRNVPQGRRLQVFPATAEVVLECVFPVSGDPLRDVEVSVDYRDFAASESGRCIPSVEGLPAGVIRCRIVPEVYDCIETD